MYGALPKAYPTDSLGTLYNVGGDGFKYSFSEKRKDLIM